jgi:hypothetical protein
MGKTYSQKVAGAFEIVDYFLLLPTGLGALMATFLLAQSPMFALTIYAVIILGIVLLVGYFKHSRNTLDSKYISALWMTTAVYNFVFLLPTLYWVATMYQDIKYENLSNGGAVTFFLICLSAVFAYITAIILSLKAFSIERYKKLL